MAHASLKAFDRLPAKERWFCRARLTLAPLEQVAARASGNDILDVGCGHGVLAALLLHDHPERRVVGIDPDVRKIEWANESIGKHPNAEFHALTIEALAAQRPASFDCVIIADVLCLIARATWPPFLDAARKLLRPDGRLLLKDAENDGSCCGARFRRAASASRRARSSSAMSSAQASSSTTSRATRAATRHRTCC